MRLPKARARPPAVSAERRAISPARCPWTTFHRRRSFAIMIESTSPYRDLAEALRERIAVIGDRDWYQRDPAGQLERLKAVSERITAIGSALPAPVDPQ